jgi:hypothetical protein
MQKWEYLPILRSRVWDAIESKGLLGKSTDWYKGTNWNMDIIQKLKELGDQGWELVSVTPRSSYLGSNSAGSDFAGFTSDELWVFKRPKG